MSDAITSFDGPYKFLSNFHYCTVTYDGAAYPTVEHAYQAQKAQTDKDRLWIARAFTPAAAKQRGKKVNIRLDWDDVKLGIMKQLLESKFEDPFLRRRLLETGDAELIEGNWWGDTYWGVCEGKGQNNLGKLLMEVRSELS